MPDKPPSDRGPSTFRLARLRALRLRAGLSEDLLGDRAHLEARTIRNLEAGLLMAGPETMAKLAAALGVEPGALIGDGA
jgi:transcriptional regulator with XRE-family HTH domain